MVYVIVEYCSLLFSCTVRILECLSTFYKTVRTEYIGCRVQQGCGACQQTMALSLHVNER